MYIPTWFRVEDVPTLHSLMRAYSFATLVTTHDNAPFATHLPFLLDAGRGPYGTLRAHVARANPHWQSFQEGEEALVIFQGPHAYISPSWYETHPSVPTWNYAAVHAYGKPRLMDEAALSLLLHDLMQTYEDGLETTASYALPEDYLQKMQRGVVGFEIEITRLEGKFKLSQNRSEADRNRVIKGLRQTGGLLEAEVAAWMEQKE